MNIFTKLFSIKPKAHAEPKPILKGNIKVHETVQLLGLTKLQGNISIGAKSIVENATLTGNIKISENCKLFGPIELSADSQINIGRSTSLNGPGLDINAKINSINIGKFCSIARKTTIQEYNHHTKSASTYFMQKHYNNKKMTFDIESKGNIEIGNDVWIGAGCCILSGAKISDGCIIGANSVISGEIAPYSIVIGNPSREIKKRFSEDIIARLLELKWWNWSDEMIIKNIHFFEGELTYSKFEALDLNG